MWRKIWTITAKDLYTTFTDRNLLLIMIATPLVLSTIIALAFGGIGSGDSSSIENIPVAVVNLDTAEDNNQGAVYVNAFVPPDARLGAAAESAEATPAPDAATTAASSAEATPAPDAANDPALDCPAFAGSSSTDGANPLYTLTAAVELDSADAARAGVDSGEYAAAIIIPQDFTATLDAYVNASMGAPGAAMPEVAQIEIYADASRTVSAGIVRGITEGITNQIVNGYVSIAAVLDTVLDDYGFLRINAVTQSDGFSTGVNCAFAGGYNLISLDRQTVEGEPQRFNALIFIGSAQAIFFALFTANGSATSILEERQNWTLQRMVMSPTPRAAILFGKLFATAVMVLVQLTFLFLAFTLISSLLDGELVFIWGNDVLSIVLVLLAASLAAAGLGAIVAASAKSAEQASIVGGVLSLVMGALGGAFFTIPSDGGVMDLLSRVSIVRWGTEAFTNLATGSDGVLLHIGVLTAFGLVTFVIGLTIFNRRLDI